MAKMRNEIGNMIASIVALPPWRQALVMATWRLMIDCNNCIASISRVNELHPNSPPRDIEHFRVAWHRLGQLAARLADGSIADGHQYSCEVAEIEAYLNQECGTDASDEKTADDNRSGP
jgi:hypothetical protein